MKPEENYLKVDIPQIISSPMRKCMSQKRLPVEALPPLRPLVLKSVALFQGRLPASFLISHLQEKVGRPVTGQEAKYVTGIMWPSG